MNTLLCFWIHFCVFENTFMYSKYTFICIWKHKVYCNHPDNCYHICTVMQIILRAPHLPPPLPLSTCWRRHRHWHGCRIATAIAAIAIAAVTATASAITTASTTTSAAIAAAFWLIVVCPCAVSASAAVACPRRCCCLLPTPLPPSHGRGASGASSPPWIEPPNHPILQPSPSLSSLMFKQITFTK